MNIDCVEKATKIGPWLDRCYRALIVNIDIIRVKPDSDLPRSILGILEHSELMQLCFVLFVADAMRERPQEARTMHVDKEYNL